MPDQEHALTAIVVNYNAGDSLASCVDSLVADGVADVLVVDNASSDRSAERLAGEGRPGVRVVWAGENLGFGGAVNRGAAETEAPYLLVSNPDLVVEPGATAALVGRLERDSDLAVCGPMLLETDGTVYPSGRDFPRLGDAIGHAFVGLVWGGNRWTKRYRHLGDDQHRSREADWVSGACFVVRHDAFDSVGGFDERYFMYVEDVDLCWRLRRAGWRVWYEPAASVVHEQGRSTALHPYRMLTAHHRSMWRFARRSADGRERWLLPVMAGGLAARLAMAFADHRLRPVRDRLRARTRVNHRARGQLQP